MEKICKHCLISGKVQGVFFRKHTRDEARSLGITGWVKNLSDGQVEVLMFGSSVAIDALLEWLHTGPKRASVENVVIEDISSNNTKHYLAYKDLNDFIVL